MYPTSKIEAYAEDFENLIKIAYIRKVKNKWVIFSEKGKRLGEYSTKQDAVKRLRQIEFFKHQKKNKKSASKDNEKEDTYSSVMRKLVKDDDKEKIDKFQKKFKEIFDQCVINRDEEPEKIAFEAAMECIAEQNYTLEKIAQVVEFGSPEFAGNYLANFIKFLLRRISPEKRQKSINNLKNKIYFINEYDISKKKMPASSALGQAISMIKNLLVSKNPVYIRNVLNSIVRNM